tara:strand:- start:1098 stop:1262 length:165 start_codon:yes stop_codon:yes gene_type:complete
MRKTLQIPAEVDKLLSKYLKKVETQQGIKISKSSWVAQAIREKMDKDLKSKVVA